MITLDEDRLVALLRHDYAFRHWVHDLGGRGVALPNRIEPDILGYFLDIAGIPPENDAWSRDSWRYVWLGIVEGAAQFPEDATRHFVQRTLCDAAQIRRGSAGTPRNRNGLLDPRD